MQSAGPHRAPIFNPHPHTAHRPTHSTPAQPRTQSAATQRQEPTPGQRAAQQATHSAQAQPSPAHRQTRTRKQTIAQDHSTPAPGTHQSAKLYL